MKLRDSIKALIKAHMRDWLGLASEVAFMKEYTRNEVRALAIESCLDVHRGDIADLQRRVEAIEEMVVEDETSPAPAGDAGPVPN